MVCFQHQHYQRFLSQFFGEVRLKLGLTVVFVVVCYTLPCFAQLEDLNIYGYIQTLAYTEYEKFVLKPFGPFANLPEEVRTNVRSRQTFSLQQLNIFLNKPFAEYFTAFINLQYALTYSSQRGWGSFSVEEAWVNYNHSDAFSLKFGLCIPVFNNLNELKNRTPLLPYLFRPPVYETNLATIFPVEDYLPERAFIQVSGFVPLGMYRIDYALHIGNSESSYIGSSLQHGPSIHPVTGEDESLFKALGGRLGIRNAKESLKFGISGTFDRDNRRDSTFDIFSGISPPIPALGDVPRYRLGLDFSCTLGDFTLEAEYINVLHDQSYSSVAQYQLNKYFYYANVLYNMNDNLYLYGLYGFINRESSSKQSINAAGFYFTGLGCGYKINDWLVAKAQGIVAVVGQNEFADNHLRFVLLGLSALF